MNENDAIRLRHMLDYSRDAVKFLEGKKLDDLNSDVMLSRALTYTVGIIGEAASNINREFQDANPQIPWPQIISMRNRLFHGYIDVKYERLWFTVNQAIPALIVELEKLIPPEE